jgi:hypothetical protein
LRRAATGNANATPGDYIRVQITYNFTALFPAITMIGSEMISSITMTNWMRLG